MHVKSDPFKSHIYSSFMIFYSIYFGFFMIHFHHSQTQTKHIKRIERKRRHKNVFLCVLNTRKGTMTTTNITHSVAIEFQERYMELVTRWNILHIMYIYWQMLSAYSRIAVKLWEKFNTIHKNSRRFFFFSSTSTVTLCYNTDINEWTKSR